MKKGVTILIALCISGALMGQKPRVQPMSEVVKNSMDFAVKQHMFLANTLKDSSTLLPKTTDWNSKLVTCKSDWWTSGFFPGSLWYLFEYSKNEQVKKMAELYTARVENQKYTTDNHDVGFMLYCSFGNGYRITGNKAYKEVLVTGAKSLSTRFREKVGCIQSWDIVSWNKNRGWQCPVIIDNMMNLELLAEATRMSGDSSFYKIAVSHANVTMENHFRPDYSSFHVVDYNLADGSVRRQQTEQGYADGSSWSRGQGWALYGYTVMYRETKDKKYLDWARRIAEYVMEQLKPIEDKIPYWDYNAPNIPDAYRDASAGALTCSALIELSQYVDKATAKRYLAIAEQQIRSLSAAPYRAELGKNGGFILKHSVGSIPGKTEVDVPLSYADYYFIEAMLRYKKVVLDAKH
ncbi:glycoside hydrolase family 88 protein [uncultured Acetobacteroides sp.]|uniref:glycoside hydrolase family 88 protein n=1 Tax=uncultured Acetobacteroides sp. TaxID=1760811 RepID=UPI0029F55CA7|nr:glycoside hydrolase family 88 protein [uncultured Acetobacteroides sp.]